MTVKHNSNDNNELSTYCNNFPVDCGICLININCLRYNNYNTHGWDRILYMKNLNEDKNKMNIKDSAKAYEKKEYKNITELERIPVNMEVLDGMGKAGTPDEFKYKYIEVNGEEVRVPYSVLEQLKAQLEENDKIEFFKATKTGKGLDTKYTVIILNK